MSKHTLTIAGLVVAMSMGLAACGDSNDDEAQDQAPTGGTTQQEQAPEQQTPTDSAAEQAEQANQSSQNMNDSGAGTTESTPPAGASTDDPQAGTMEGGSQGSTDSSTSTGATAGDSVSEDESQTVPEDDVRANNETSNTMSQAEHAEQMNNPDSNTGGKSDSQQ